MNKTKPLHIGITCYPTIGGSGIVATNLGLELAKLGHQVHFISYDRPFRAQRLPKNTWFHKVDISSYELFKYPDYTLPLAVKMNEVHHKHHLDILHVHYAVPHAVAALLAEDLCEYRCGSHPKVVTTLHGTDITLLGRDENLRAIIKYSIEKSDGVTAVSNSLKADTVRLFHTKKRIKTIYNFYDPKRPRVARELMRRRLGIKASQVLAVHSSNLRRVKRVPDLLEAFALAVKSAPLKLLILAGGNFKPYEPLVKKLKLREKIMVRSNVTNIEDYLNAADLGYYASEEESFGLGILESMEFSHPVVATKAGGIPEVVEHGKSGLLFRVGDKKGLAAGLVKLATDDNYRRRMGQAAAQRAMSHFSPEKIVKNYLEFYYSLLK